MGTAAVELAREYIENVLWTNRHLLTPLGALTVTYVTARFLYSVWSGLKVYVFAPALGLGVDLKKLGQWAGIVLNEMESNQMKYVYLLIR